MAMPVRTPYSVGAGKPIHGGRYPGGHLSGGIALADVSAGGTLGSVASALYGNVVLDDVVPAASGAPDVFDSMAYAIGVDSTGYLLGWPAGSGVSSYSYSVDGGATWTARALNQWALVTGRTPSSVDVVIVRAFGPTGLYSDMSCVVGLAAPGTQTTIFSVIGTGTNPLTGGACDYPTPQAWAAAGATINGGNNSLVATGKRLIGLGLKNSEFVNAPVVIGDGTSAGLGNNTLTTSSTCYRELNVFPGHSFCDNVNRFNTELRYNFANGAGMRRGSSTSDPVVGLHEAFSRLARWQLASHGTGVGGAYGGWGVHSSSPTWPVFMDRVLVESGTDKYLFSFNYGDNHTISNSVAIQMRPLGQPTPETITEEHNGADHFFCTVVALGQAPAIAMTARVAQTYWESCGIFGALRLFSLYTTGVGGSSYPVANPTFLACKTDMQYAVDLSQADIPIPAGITQTTPLSSYFRSTTLAAAAGSGTHDLRLSAGSPMRGAGVANADYPCDIFYRRRPVAGPVDAGALQYAA